MALLWPLFSDIRSAWKKVNYICWKRLVLVHFRRFYEIMYIAALLCVWTYFYFAWKGTLETLNVKCLFAFIPFQRDVEAVAQRCSMKRCLWKFLKTHRKIPEACNFIKKETLTQVFSCEFYGISKNMFLAEHLRWLLLQTPFYKVSIFGWVSR